MGIYDRDYYREKKREDCWKKRIFKFSWYLILLLFFLAFVVYVLAILSEK
ncbi:hypothetical protein SAMN06269117_1228 [Balnearium lithotrophicum]|jgi:uncharacterized BrkB/YihY/UPF0761 family membrane protein|uniref:Uncharacterized protein n=1 Tax=Balnearium lithotrophicum TaxID=223788 RepID=A0A521DMK9_9BACT|nr:hypothetical protein [Balnearium lithotrophicum]SMO72180.1 hypothetical protein SAMN06269117_1228 [Balnearium lithotrophicum]